MLQQNVWDKISGAQWVLKPVLMLGPKFCGNTGLQVIKLQLYLEMLLNDFQYVCTAISLEELKREELKDVQYGMKLL